MKMKQKIDEKMYICMVHSLLVLLGISQFFGIEITNILISVSIAGLMLYLPADKQIIALFTAMPFFNLFSMQIGTTSIYYLYVIIYIIKILKHNNWRIGKKRFIILILGFVLTTFWMDIVMQLKWMVLFALLVINYQNKIFLARLDLIVKHTGISTITASIVGYIMLIAEKSIYTKSIIYSTNGTTTRFAGLVGDSVFFGQFCVVVISSLLVMVLLNRLSARFAYVSAIILSWFALLTFSKTAIILLVIAIFSYCVSYININIQKKVTLYRSIFAFTLVCIALIGIGYYIITHLDNIVIQGYIIRFTSTDLWTGRTSVSDNYLEKINSSLKHLVVGMPYSTYIQNGVVVGGTMITRAHNIFIETVCLFGALASFIIIGYCIVIVSKFLLRKNKRLYILAPFAILLISGISLHGHLEWPYYFLVSLSTGLLDYSLLSTN